MAHIRFSGLISLACISFILCEFCYAQESTKPTRGHYVFPYSGTSSQVQELLSNNMPGKEKVVIIFLTPRFFVFGEAVIQNCTQQLLARNIPVFGIIKAERFYSTIQYLYENSFAFPILLDTAATIWQSLGLDEAPPFVTIWNNDGTFLWSDILYGKYSIDTIVAAYTTTTALPPIPTPQHDVSASAHTLPQTWKKARVDDWFSVQEDSLICLDKITSIQFTRNNEQVLLHDNKMQLHLYTWKKETHSSLYQQHILPNFAYYQRLLSGTIPDSIIQQERSRGLLPDLLLDAVITHNDSIIVFVSIPYIHTYTHEAQHYEVCEIQKKLFLFTCDTNGNWDSIIQPIPFPANESKETAWAAFTPVGKIWLSPDENRIYFNISKGYPTVGMDTSIANDATKNPLRNEFYEQSPLFESRSLYKSVQKDIEHCGTLSRINQDLGTGYYLAGQRITFSDTMRIIAQQLVPWLECSNGKRIPLKGYFNPALTTVKDKAISLPNYTHYRNLFNSVGAGITHLWANTQKVYVLWKILQGTSNLRDARNDRLVQVYNLKDGSLVGEWSIPSHYHSSLCQTIGWDEKQERVAAVYQNATTTTVVMYKLEP